MSKTGTVTSWRGPFGFAEMEDGTPVFIHTDEIDGGKLRVGLEVKFDLVEGEEGKFKGANVSGEAVLAKGTELSEEDKAAEHKRMQEHREKREQQKKKEFDEIWSKVSGMKKKYQLSLLRKLVQDLDMGTLEPKRADPTQKGGKKFTKGEFLAFYGADEGGAMWNDAAPKGKGGHGSKPPAITKE